jgi:hypothetical protein
MLPFTISLRFTDKMNATNRFLPIVIGFFEIENENYFDYSKTPLILWWHIGHLLKTFNHSSR